MNRFQTLLSISACARLNLEYDEPLSNVAFNFNLRRYTKVYMSILAEADPVNAAGTAGAASRHVIGWRLTQATRVQDACR